MSYVIINDASCLIDLRKGRLLHVMLKLPYRFVVPFPIRQSELLEFTPQEWQLLTDGGMEIFDLSPTLVSEAIQVKAAFPRLSANDCFCVVATRCHENGILLTGDSLLRRVASAEGLEVHGVLWIVDELMKTNACDHELLASALAIWRDDLSVFLPPKLIAERLRRLD